MVENMSGQVAGFHKKLVQVDTEVVDVLSMEETVTGFEGKLNAIDKTLSEDYMYPSKVLLMRIKRSWLILNVLLLLMLSQFKKSISIRVLSVQQRVVSLLT
ncbi:hypothetical protein SO802_026005 [Lithocarpus litseifolius]|uniref:Uncharacterized protein n=1 Tax=Lithocarpus litseifolius TaxID=425828 RepID=A0AAW2C3S1_9ROSI